MKKVFALLMILVMLLNLAACKSSVQPGEVPEAPSKPVDEKQDQTEDPTKGTLPVDPAMPDDTSETEGTSETEAPQDPPSPEMDYNEVLTVRIQDVSQKALEALMATYSDLADLDDDIPSFLLEDAERLQEFVKRLGSEALAEKAAGYSPSFFEDHDLLAIPRVSSSGSVRYSVEMWEDGIYTVARLTAQMPEVGTTDMANWIILVPVVRTERVPAAAAEGGWHPVPGDLVTE